MPSPRIPSTICCNQRCILGLVTLYLLPVSWSSLFELLKCASSVGMGQEGEDRPEENPDADAVERRQKLQQLRDELRALRQQRAEVGAP